MTLWELFSRKPTRTSKAAKEWGLKMARLKAERQEHALANEKRAAEIEQKKASIDLAIQEAKLRVEQTKLDAEEIRAKVMVAEAQMKLDEYEDYEDDEPAPPTDSPMETMIGGILSGYVKGKGGVVDVPSRNSGSEGKNQGNPSNTGGAHPRTSENTRTLTEREIEQQLDELTQKVKR